MILAKAWAFVVKDFLTEISYRVWFAGQLVFVFFMVAAFFFFGRMFEGLPIPALQAYGGDYFSFVLVGLAFSSYLGVAIRSFSDSIRQAQVLGTLEALLVTPTPVAQVVFLSPLYAFLSTSLRVVVTLLVGWWFFDANFQGANWGGALLTLILTMLAFSCLGIFSAGVVLAFKRADPSSWLVQGFSYLFGGVYYPVSVLPEWGQWVAQILPITHALQAMRKLLLLGEPLQAVADSLLALVLFVLVAGPLSMAVFLYALRRVKREGSLSHF